ncbi:p-loop containing nucleoside triphosphate hydrolase protein [Mycena kentingensis (nom. inval.)]|nr:p-loop containing nucleoside triphosphate hydrolase protein [Mycena kentingensis (nom. inval.)]
MPKRRAAASSDDEASVTDTPASKRARTDDDSEQGSPAPPPPKRAPNGKGKARRKDDESESEAGEDDDEKNGADAEFEAEYEEKIRADYESKQKKAGGVAEFGIIESIELKQFMCHQRLTFSFGPQINFIIGHNGSGKSAVLTAITVALGGKASVTGRGNGLKSFIREGQNAAEVELALKNQGEEAYKPKEYGKSIIINRRFTKEGSSSWKIKSKDGRVISTKKDELAAICDHMNIQVDNPMNVLTQDSARQFLSASTPGDKYKFFLRGTQLSQLSDEYSACLNNVSATARVLQQKKEAIPDLKAAFKDATARFEEASKARDQARKVEELKKELAWAHVNTKQAEMEAKQENVAKQERRLPKIEESIKKAEDSIAECDANIAALEEVHKGIGDADDLHNQLAEFHKKLRDLAAESRANTNEIKGINDELKDTDKTIKALETEIAKEMKRLEKDTESAREAKQNQIKALREKETAADKELTEIADKIADAERAIADIRRNGEGVDQRVQEAQRNVDNCKSNIDNCKTAERDKYLPYGYNIQQVLHQIANTRWRGQRPIGPLGLYVTLKERDYAETLRLQLGQMLTSFAITDGADFQPLKKILDNSRNSHITIHRFVPDRFDFSRGEPPLGIMTAYRALDFSDDDVCRIFVNKASIESRVLARTRAEGERTLRDLGQGMAWTMDKFNLTRYPDGGESSVPSWDGRVHAMLLAAEATSEISRYQSEMVHHEQALQQAKAQKQQLNQQYNNAQKELEGLKRSQKAVDQRRFAARNEIKKMQEELNADVPIQLGAVQNQVDEYKESKRPLLAQIEGLANRKNELDASHKDLTRQRDAVQKQISEFDDKQKESSDACANAAVDRTKLQHQLEHYQKKLADEQEKVNEAKEAAEVVVQEFEEWTAKAEEYCERVITKRSPDVIQRNLTAVQTALQEREKQQGASVDEMTIEVNRAKERLEKATNDHKQMQALNNALKDSLHARLARWQEFRSHIALRCKIVFSLHLSQRGYYGKVIFDHDKETLQLKVQTDDQAATQGASRDKDPKSLSGGEKSFSTICLLLSLWESIGCPIRCLDEFDVFMDAVNRRISMKMMIDTANSSDKKQYILITPQDMNNIAPGPTVRVQRMSDPERNQGVLQFAS